MPRFQLPLLLLLALGCSGQRWVEAPLEGDEEEPDKLRIADPAPAAVGANAASTKAESPAGEVATAEDTAAPLSVSISGQRRAPKRVLAGKVLGTFDNTYYDFPRATEFSGSLVSLFDGDCKEIGRVPEGFHDTLCVQGSGFLASGQTVSFTKRDCECARTCPRTGQKICFDRLSSTDFPWGRGATGKPIAPLLTVAVDSAVIPLGTPLYIPEFDGVPKDEGGRDLHDGCFIAQDRGLKVTGKHIDLFTGDQRTTRLWNQLVPTHAGITVVLDHPSCARAGK